eukprot:TRINITY_DN12076_c0_g1_i1.p1 TRINITY_DN12076_c0_g1~~TRINITY_DN12076_c0_g1_i1.p1  ORF type:complete len:456 (-),score=107.54 TRINITY_DN12076_c0_g1_i1:161-1387(-)
MKPEYHRTRCIIIGGGPAGLTAAIYTGRANLRPVVAHGGFEGGSMIPGGQLMITTEVENFPGFPEGVSGPDLMERMQKQAANFNIHELYQFATKFIFNTTQALSSGSSPGVLPAPTPAQATTAVDTATATQTMTATAEGASPPATSAVEGSAESHGAQGIHTKIAPHRVELDGGRIVVDADAVILAMGAQARWLGAENEEKYVNKGISACATCDGPLPMFRGKTIMVVGGGDSAVEEATFLTKFASHVYMVVRRDQLRASKAMQDRAFANSKLTILWNTAITAYHGGADGNLAGVDIENTSTKEKSKMECTGVFMAIGHDPCTKSLRSSGLNLDPAGYIAVRDNVWTSIPGVFSAGDIHDTHYRQAITAAGLGCMAAIAAERWLEEHRPEVTPSPAAAAASHAAAASK